MSMRAGRRHSWTRKGPCDVHVNPCGCFFHPVGKGKTGGGVLCQERRVHLASKLPMSNPQPTCPRTHHPRHWPRHHHHGVRGDFRCRGNAQVELVEMGALHMAKIKDHALKLKRIYDRVSALIDTHAPDELAVQAPFFGQNVQSMLKLGRHRAWPWRQRSPRKSRWQSTHLGGGNRPSQEAGRRPKSRLRGWCSGRCRFPARTCPRIWMRPMGWRWRCATITNWPRPKCNAGWWLEGLLGRQSRSGSQGLTGLSGADQTFFEKTETFLRGSVREC